MTACFLLRKFAPDAAPPSLTDLLTDTSNHTMASVARPAYATPRTDPIFGTALYRITDPGQPMINNPSRDWGDQPRIVYPRFHATNADDTLVYLTQNEGGGGSGGGTWVECSPPFEDVYSRSHPAGWVEGRWHNTDPRQMVYCTDTQLRRLYIGPGSPADNTTVLIKDFGALGYSGVTIGLFEGEQSRDSDVWPITATLAGAEVAFAYKISTDTISALITPDLIKPYGDGCNIITYDGQYMVVFFDDETFRTYSVATGTLVYTSTVEQQPSHYAMGRANNGDRVVVGGDRSDSGNIVMVNVVTGAVTEINAFSFCYHYSCANHDWNNSDSFGLGDYWPDSGNPLVNELVFHLFDDSGIARVGHIHRGAHIAYSHEVHPTMSRDGRYVFFKVEWEGSSSAGPVCAYAFDLSGMQIPGHGGWA